MDVRMIRYFLAVAEEGSFRGAARREGVSQPAVSQAIALLEEEVGGRLFDRVARRVSLTAEGRLLLAPARRLVDDLEDLRTLVDRARGEVRGRLELGTTDAASIYVLPRVYRAFRRRHPGADLSVRVEGTEPLLRQMAERSVEIAIVSLSVGDRTAALPGPGFTAEPLHREELQLILSARHPLAARRRLNLADLADTPLITFKEESITRRAVAALFAAAGVEPRVAMEISSPEAIKKLVEVGLGASVLPARSVAAEVRAGTLVTPAVRGGKLHRVLGVVRDARRTASPAAQAFLELLEQVRNVPRTGAAMPGS
jgi:DNA-binding transcriptional LysR family regulator